MKYLHLIKDKFLLDIIYKVMPLLKSLANNYTRRCRSRAMLFDDYLMLGVEITIDMVDRFKRNSEEGAAFSISLLKKTLQRELYKAYKAERNTKRAEKEYGRNELGYNE